ncbi:hypothetical protein FQ021_25525, partial [Escherichia coli]|nr:hypothetical protein [Escherichia coli]
RKKLYEYRNANEQNISVKMRSPEHYLNDDVFNSENRLSARGFLPPIEPSYKFKLLTLMVELS